MSCALGTNGHVISLALYEYDPLGRMVHSANPLGGVTTNLYGQEAGGRTEVTVFPDGGTRTHEYYLDGSLRRVTGSAVAGMAYGYGVETVGDVVCTWTAQTNLNTDGSATGEWSRTYTDPAGRRIKTVYAPGTAFETWNYNALGQLERHVDPDGVTTLYLYNAQGQLETTVLDMNGNSGADLDGPDRVTRTEADHLTINAGGWTNVPVQRTRLWQRDDTNDEVLVSEQWLSVDGLRQASIAFGLTNQTLTEYLGSGQRRLTRTAPDGVSTVSLFSYGQIQTVTNSATQAGTSYVHDSHGRVWQMMDARNGTTTLAYNEADLVVTNISPDPDGAGPDQPQVIVTQYDTSLRATNVVHPDATSTRTDYYPNGLLQKTWGSRTYPVDYGYDYAGRMTNTTTWQEFNHSTGQGISGAATTTWNYDQYRGWLESKRYHDGQGPDYTYTAAARLDTRTWARGVETDYNYSAAGELAAVDYSDATPDIGYGYDRGAARPRSPTAARSGSPEL